MGKNLGFVVDQHLLAPSDICSVAASIFNVQIKAIVK